MSRQILNRGTTANDGTGDTLRVAAQKINENFGELYSTIGGDDASSTVTLTSAGAVFEGSSPDDHETTLIAVEPTADNNVYIPNDGGTLILDSCAQTLTNKTILSPSLTTPSIKDADSSHAYNFVVGNLAANRNVTLPVLSGNDTFVFANHTETLSNKTLITPVIKNPTLGGLSGGASLFDSSSNQYLTFSKVSSAVNHVNISNSATGNNPSVDVDGGDANIGLELSAKGTGGIEIKNKLVLEKGTDVSSSAGVDLNEPLTVFNSGSLISPTIGDGTTQGEMKTFMNVGAGEVRLTTGSPSKIFGVGNNGYVSFSEGDGCILVWNDTKSKWFFVSNNGTTIG
jgi:hypothetical protein